MRLVGGERVLSRVGIVEVKINPLFSPPFSQAVFQLYDHYDFTALSAGLKAKKKRLHRNLRPDQRTAFDQITGSNGTAMGLADRTGDGQA